MFTKQNLLEIIQKVVYDYGYDEFSEIIEGVDNTLEKSETIIVKFECTPQCDASIIYDLSGMLSNITADICNLKCVPLGSDVYNLPYVYAEKGFFTITFRVLDYIELQ